MNILWYLIIGILVAFVQAWIYKRFSLHKVSYSRKFGKTAVFEGEYVEMVEVIRNQKLLPLPWIRVESRMSTNLRFKRQSNLDINGERYHKSLFSLFGYRQITRKHQVQCIRRGYYILNSAALTSGDLFGLGEASKNITLNTDIMVYPKVLPLSQIPITTNKWQGDVVVDRWIVDDPFLINGIREYRNGDSQKDIHWPATARTGQLQVKTHDFTSSPRLLIYLNIQTSEDLWGEISEQDKEVIEKGISYAASLASKAIENGIEVGFFCNAYCSGQPEKSTIRVMPACSEEQLLVLLETMAKLVIFRQKSFHSFWDEDIEEGLSGMDMLVISTYWSDLIEEKANELRKLGNMIQHIPLERGGEQNEENMDVPA